MVRQSKAVQKVLKIHTGPTRLRRLIPALLRPPRDLLCLSAEVSRYVVSQCAPSHLMLSLSQLNRQTEERENESGDREGSEGSSRARHEPVLFSALLL